MFKFESAADVFSHPAGDTVDQSVDLVLKVRLVVDDVDRIFSH